MEDFAGIIVFFVVIGLIDKLNKKSKKKQKPNAQPAARAAAPKAAPVREVALPAQPVKKAAVRRLFLRPNNPPGGLRREIKCGIMRQKLRKKATNCP